MSKIYPNDFFDLGSYCWVRIIFGEKIATIADLQAKVDPILVPHKLKISSTVKDIRTYTMNRDSQGKPVGIKTGAGAKQLNHMDEIELGKEYWICCYHL